MKIKSKYYYLLSLVFVFIIPSCIAGYFVWDSISKFNLISFVLLIACLGSLWDIWASKHGRSDPVWLWQFNFKDNLGIKIFGLPVEEYLFYIFSSIYIIFIWELIRLASSQGSLLGYTIPPLLSCWSLAFALLPYWLSPKNDRL
jgi:lycopene cyclase domain-containing protein